jgi:hypothetical protein
MFSDDYLGFNTTWTKAHPVPCALEGVLLGVLLACWSTVVLFAICTSIALCVTHESGTEKVRAVRVRDGESAVGAFRLDVVYGTVDLAVRPSVPTPLQALR